MDTVKKLLQDIADARKAFLDQLNGISEIQAHYKPQSDVWSVLENTEHLFWAEQGGIAGMWKTLHAIRNGEIERKTESVHKNMPVEEIVSLTWKDKEIVPPVAAPRVGGPLMFWSTSLDSLQDVLESFCNDLKEDELRLQAHPHPISGPVDFHQRLEFLRFHIYRHKDQVKSLLAEINQSK
jgi:hypothetical protein